eukprot:6797766-Prymnesium_polylepis.2
MSEHTHTHTAGRDPWHSRDMSCRVRVLAKVPGDAVGGEVGLLGVMPPVSVGGVRAVRFNSVEFSLDNS